MAEYFISFEDARHDLFTAAAYIAERIKSGDGHAEAMTAIVPQYLSMNNVDLAAELANSVEDPFTRDKLLTEVAEKCAGIDDDEYALQLADTVEEFGLRSQAFERIALQKVYRGQIEKAIEIAESMTHPDYVYASAAAKLASEGKREEAADVLARVEFPSAMVSALQAMAVSELAAGNKDECLSLLDQAKEAAGEIEHNEERIRTICEIGNHYVDAGRNDLAIGAYDVAKEEAAKLDNIHRDSFIAAAVMGFLHAGSMDTADRTLDLVADKTQVANCLLAFARHYWEKDEKDEALEALDEAYQILRSQRDIETRDSRARYALFGSIAAQFAGFEKAERAGEIAQEIEDEAQRTQALSQIAVILSMRREDQEARHTLNAVAEDADRAFALISMSDVKENIGDHADAIALLDEAAHLAEAVPQLSARSSVYNEIARRYSEYGETPKAASICRINLQTIGEIRDKSRQAVCLAGLAFISEQAGLDLAETEDSLLQSILAKTARQ
jgi:tetratricopeptide (TPR) repeat protein